MLKSQRYLFIQVNSKLFQLRKTEQSTSLMHSGLIGSKLLERIVSITLSNLTLWLLMGTRESFLSETNNFVNGMLK